jgi:hypothetical protein
VLFFDDSISYFVSHLRSVRIYLDVFSIVFVKRSGLFRPITLAAITGGLLYFDDISILLMFICVSLRKSAVLTNRGCVDFTVPEINRIMLFSCISILLVCTLFNHTAERSIQQSNRQVPMKQFIMFQRFLPNLCQSVSAPSYREQQLDK